MDEKIIKATLKGSNIKDSKSKKSKFKKPIFKESKFKESTLQEKLEEWNQKARVLKQKAGVLNKRKDFLHLILSYPVEPKAEVDFDSLKSTLFRINQQVRELEVCLAQEFHVDKYKLFEEIEKGIRDVRGSLAKSFGMVAYLPQDMVENILELPKADTVPSTTSKSEEARRKGEMLCIPQGITNLAIEFAIRQISKCIKEGEIRRIGISGFLAEKVAEALKDLPEIRSMFDFVFCISVSRHHSIKEIEWDIALQINEIRRTVTSKAPLDNFLMLLDCIDEDRDLHELKIPDDGFLMLTSRSHNVYQIMDLDLEIRTEDHLLPWELFCKNVGQILVHSSSLQDMAVRLIERCNGHLLAIILLAWALKDVTDVGVWDLALHELTSQLSSQVEGISEVMVRVLSFIWVRKDIDTKNCIQYCASHPKGTKFRKPSLVNHWIAYGLIEKQEKGEDILKDLINSFLMEKVNEDSVRMREETRLVLLNLFRPGVHPLNPEQVEEWDDEEKHLMNNELTELPERPICPNLRALFLQMSDDLMVIPTTFFERMPVLQVLDLSYTSIKCLPPSISKLVALRKFFLKGCELLKKLPPQIGALRNLQMFDGEGTELICLPKEIGELINLTCLKVSFYGHANRCRESNQIDEIIPRTALSKLAELKELIIDVNPDGEWWDGEVKVIINGLCSLRKLETLNLYLPTVELLQQFLQLKRNSDQSLIYPALSHFRLTVGRHNQRIISRLPQELEKDFKNLDKCLKCINGEDKTIEITNALEHAKAFFLERHWTVKKLSEFGKDEMSQLKFCLLVECNEIRTIIEGGEFYGKEDNEEDNNPVLGSLQYLNILYMKNLESIWEGPIVSGCLSYLKSLALHTCPSLATIFTLALLPNLVHLKELIVEDCPKIHSLVSLEASCSESNRFLPSLKKISLLDLSELISIFSGLHIAPQLERMIIYNCPKLETLSTMEVSSKDLKVIKGEREWWDALKWHESEWSSGQPDYLVRIFVPLRMDEDLMAQLAEDGNSSFLKVQNAGVVQCTMNPQTLPCDIFHVCRPIGMIQRPLKDLPLGFSFYPTEEELISFYLHNKLEGRREDLDRVIPVVDIYEFNPWDLPQFAGELCHGDFEQWFFFVPIQEKEARGGRPNRLTNSGYWKATGSPGYVYSSGNRIIGIKRTRVFYTGRAPTGTKTKWKMKEYRAIEEKTSSSSIAIPKLRLEFSLCRVYTKSKCLRAFDRQPSTAATGHRAHHGDGATSHLNQPMMGRSTSSPEESSSSGDHANPSQIVGSDHNLDMAIDNEPLWIGNN